MSASISCQHWWFCSAISPAGRPREQYGLHRCHPSSCGKKAPPTRRGFWAELYSQSFCAPHLLSGTVLLSYCWVSTTAERRGGGTRGARRENRRQMRENRQKMRENRQETVSKWGQTGRNEGKQAVNRQQMRANRQVSRWQWAGKQQMVWGKQAANQWNTE